jgi:hypothetical protein
VLAALSALDMGSVAEMGNYMRYRFIRCWRRWILPTPQRLLGFGHARQEDNDEGETPVKTSAQCRSATKDVEGSQPQVRYR